MAGTSHHRSVSSVTDARAAAAEIAADMRGGDLLDHAFERRVAHLDSRDRRWTQELVYGMLRKRGQIDAWLAARARGGLARLDADVADLLRLGTYQIVFMGSVPAYAGIAQTVEQVKRRHGIGASTLANAVLRRLDRERALLEGELTGLAGDPIDALATRYSHPRWLVARWVARWGEAETTALLESNNVEAPIVVRPWGVVREQLEAMLEAAGVSSTEVPLLDDGLQLTSPVSLAELGAWRQGTFFIQDPAATLVTRYAAIAPGSTVIDLCAAPGGKSLELARTAGHVIAADKSEARLA
ncbi:MAG: hypothetical protein H7066_17825, partial [Cytophagaceae bacterium]|nr:hypothetical protein [Gemmatimonadaceae bacterium]